jgi:hypothetical protein
MAEEPIVRRLGVYAQTGTGVCTAIRQAFERTDGASRYWTLVETQGTSEATTALIIRCLATDARLVFRASNTAPATVLCSYHPAPNNEGDTEEIINLNAALGSNLTTIGTPELRISGNDTQYTLSHATYGVRLSASPALDSGFVVEMEDAITVVFSGTATAVQDNWVYSCHAGLIISPENLNDASYGIDGSGLLCGFFGLTTIGTYSWLQTSNVAQQSRVRIGPATWGEAQVSGVFPPLGNYITPTQIAPIGDAGNVERLVPWRIYSDDAGVIGSMRYVRQRYLKKAVAVTTPALASAHLSDKDNVIVGVNDKVVLGSNANIAWIHQVPFDGSAGGVQQNMVHIWNNNGHVS